MKINIPINNNRVAKEAREKRMADRKSNTPANPTNKVILEAINDLSDQISDLYKKLQLK